MPKVGYKHSPEHNARISAGLRKAASTDGPRRKRYAGWECPEGFEDFYDDLVVKLGKDDARKMIEEEAARQAARRSA